MAKKVFVNRAKMSTATTGTGAITLGSAVAGFQSFEDGGVVNGDEIRYVIEDGDNWEIGTGVYTSVGTSLTRTVLESNNADAALNLSGNAYIFITSAADDFVQLDGDVMTGNLGLQDDVKIQVGTDNDLEIVHDGTDTIINERGTGALKVQVSGVDVATFTANGISTDITGDLTGNVSGNVTGDVTGNADTATTLATARNIELSGDVTGTASFDGSANINITATVGDDSHDHANATTSTDGFMSAADKTKIDGIEAAATADQTDAEIKTAYENNADTNAFTDAEKTKLSGIEASADVTDATNVQAAGAVMDSELTNEAAVKALNQGVATTDDVTFNSVTTTADVSIGANADIAGYIDFTAIDHPTHQQGRVYYDTNHKTLSYQSDISGVEHEVGIEEHVRAYNNTGSTIAKGSPVYWSGNSGGEPTIALANATSSTKYNVQGLAAHDIADASSGYVIVSGLVSGFDTSGLNAGANFFAGLTDGALQNDPPSYPNYPMCLGWVIVSDATNGEVLVNQQNHSVNSFRVQGDTHIGGDLTVTGNLQIDGSQTTTSSNNVSLGASFQYLNAGDTIGQGNTTFTGTGLDDAYFSGHFTGTVSTTYYVKIDGVGTGTGGVDTFKWSVDNFATTAGSNIDITGEEQLIHSADNIGVNFGSTTGHTLDDQWDGTATPANVDTGLFTNFNTGNVGTGYTHTGFFYSASTGQWTLAGEYDPEPEGTINTSHASFQYGTLRAGTFIGALTGNVTGNVTGNASTATALATGRTISLTGDVTGTSAAFNGSGNVSITATVADDSHNHVISNVDGLQTSLDGKLPLSGGAMTGAITTNSTFDGRNVSVDGAKLDGIESGATADQTAAEIRALVESATDSNVFTDADHTKLNGIETGATADQTAAEIRTLVEAATDSNVFTDADHTKLNGIEASADVTDTINVVAALTAGSNITIAANGTISSSFTDTNTTYSAGGGLSLSGTTFSHTDTSSQSSINNSGATVIQDVTVDTYGHVTGLGSTTLTAAAVGAAASSHTHTSSQITDLEEFVEDQIGANIIAGSNITKSYNDTTGQTTISSTDTNTTYSAGGGLSLSGTTFSHTDTSSQGSVNNSGRTYIQDITLDTYGHITGITSATETVVNTDTNYYLSSASWNTGNGVLTLNRSGLGAVTVDLDGRYSTTDTNTTYSAGSGLSLSGTTFSVQNDLRGEVWNIGRDNNDYISVDGTQINFVLDGNTDMRLYNSGDLHVDGNVIAYSTSISDERLKTDIVKIDSALDKVDQINGYTFTYTTDGKKSAGVIAQEVEKVLPSAITESTLPLKMGEDDKTEYKTVQYDQLIGLLVEAVKELKAEVAELKGK